MVVSSLAQLNQMCLNKSPSPAELATTDSQEENIQAILGLLEQSEQGDHDTAALKALHLVVGAVNGEEAVLCAFLKVPYYVKLVLSVFCNVSL